MSTNKLLAKRKGLHKKKSINLPHQEPDKIISENEPNLDFNECVQLSASKISRTNSMISNISENERIFEDFKIQYDELRLKYEEKLNENSELIMEKKKMQIQLMNSDTKYFEKEIKRLRGQVEKYQEENEDNKHKFFLAENQKKELEATTRIKSEQNKQLLQKLEKEKIQVVQFRHQLSEKEKFYQRITSEMEKSNQYVSTSFEEANLKVNKLETGLKTKNSDYEHLQRNYEVLNRKLVEAEKLAKKNREMYEKVSLEKTKTISDLQIKLREETRTSKDTIQKLQFDLQELKNKRNLENLLVDKKVESSNSVKNHLILELELAKQQEENRGLKMDLKDKCQTVALLQSKLKNTFSQEEKKEMEKKIKDLQNKKVTTCTYYEEKLLRLQKENEQIKFSQNTNPGEQKEVNPEFQELLKNQIEENAKIRAQLSIKIDEVFNAKADVEEQKAKLRILEEQVSILQKKIKSQDKNHKIQVDIACQNMKNDIDSLRRKLQTNENKLKAKTKEVKEKETFIMNTIVGRSKQEDVPLIMSEFQRIFQAEYTTKLAQAQQQIDELTK